MVNFGYLLVRLVFGKFCESICRYLSKIYAKSHFVLWGPGLFICFAAESFARFGVCFRDGLEVDGRENFEFGENFVSLVCAVRLLWRLLGTVVLLSGMT